MFNVEMSKADCRLRRSKIWIGLIDLLLIFAMYININLLFSIFQCFDYLLYILIINYKMYGIIF